MYLQILKELRTRFADLQNLKGLDNCEAAFKFRYITHDKNSQVGKLYRPGQRMLGGGVATTKSHEVLARGNASSNSTVWESFEMGVQVLLCYHSPQKQIVSYCDII